jgi:TonB family protein
VRDKLSIKRIGFVVALILCGCTTQLPFAGEPMPPAQVATFLKVVTPRSEYDTPPKFLRGFAPFFPPPLAGKGQWGYADLDFAVQPDGSTSDFRLVEATVPDFGRAAAIAVQKWKFTPALKNGRPVRVRVRLPFTFRS